MSSLWQRKKVTKIPGVAEGDVHYLSVIGTDNTQALRSTEAAGKKVKIPWTS